MSNEEIDARILKSLSAEKKKILLTKLGLIPLLPSIISNINDDDIYSTKDLAEFLKISPQHVTRLCRQGTLDAFQSVPRGKYMLFGKNIKDFLNRSYYPPKKIEKLAEKFLNE
ncbi:hypothetical protein Desaci_3967 [Desulfosporosinus acidiphilus SJ4]|uniref:Helix-turn-helix domain-containing protein n=1 Tax=Desulfosporosinus acidiphilus (strain DSM 22704 / JCM 16185 / SJ4) TaxID=646529 RepID=I4DAL1_DESAJ|nr:helix-turn-helix domain-containing protein [Desulfosporosinus acidiphilus]AFM42835.1 hypothetical protein Desaci_3967 [Desulfosporosinus acidiphilus SJ4]